MSGLEGCDDWGEYLTVAALVGLGSRGKTGKKSFFCQGRMSETSKISFARKQSFKNVLLLRCGRGYCDRSSPP